MIQYVEFHTVERDQWRKKKLIEIDMTGLIDGLQVARAFACTWLVMAVLLLLSPLLIAANLRKALHVLADRLMAYGYGTTDPEEIKWIERDRELNSMWP